MADDLELESLFADGVPAQGTGGMFVPLPSMPLLRQPEDGEESTGTAIATGRIRQKATGDVPEVPVELESISIGDEVVLPKGSLPKGATKSRVQWVSLKKRRIGVGDRRGGGYTFFSFEKFEKLSGRRIAEEVHKQRVKAAKEEKREAPKKAPKMPDSINLPEGRVLYAHQIENIAFLTEKKRGLIADEMGLGKSATAIVALEAPAVVVCPAHLKINWAREIAMWQPDLSVAIIEGRVGQKSYKYDPKEPKKKRRTSRPSEEEVTQQVDRIQKTADVVIVNYDILATNLDWILERRNKTLISDESHYVKSMDIRWDKTARRHVVKKGAQRAKAFYQLQDSIDRLYLLTGTPIMNRVKELFPLLHMIDKREWNSGYNFCMRYCAAHYEWVFRKGGRGEQEQKFKCDGRSNTRELHEKIKGVYMMRHTKEEELADLPPKLISNLAVRMSQKWQNEYRRADQDFLRWLEEEGGFEAVSRAQMAEALVRLNKLRVITAMGKVAPAVDYITKFFESTGRPLVVFALHISAIEGIETGLAAVNRKVVQAKREGRMPPISREIRYDKMIGGMTPAKRQDAIDRFQRDGDTDVLIYSIPIATGTTLTRAQDALFVERMWRPADLSQAEDRLHRIGQKNNVFIWYMDAEDSIDQHMSKLLAEKSEAFAAVIDGVDVSALQAAKATLGEMLVDMPGFRQLTSEQRHDVIAALSEGEEVDPLEQNRHAGGYRDAYEEAAKMGITMAELLGEASDLTPNIGTEDTEIFDDDYEWRDDYDV